MKAPVIFLTFANDPDEHLALLKRERKNIVRTLREHDDSGQVKVEAEAGATIEDVFEMFRTYQDQIAIFHYAGHASGTQLRLEGEGTENVSANADGLAQFLGQQEALKLVFLNGCATGPQVDLLLASGVKAVIATATKIQDKMATEFSEQFYYELATYSNIERAFKSATSFVKSKYANHPGVQSYRGRRSASEQKTPEGELPWGLYVADGEEDVLSWRIPERAVRTQVYKNRMSYEVQPDVNDLLIETVCEELAKYSPSLDYELNQDNLDVPGIIREIVDSFPLPIGEQLRKLFTISNDPSHPDEMELFTLTRLHQLYYTYRATLQFISFTLLSQLWDEKFKTPELEIGDDHIVQFNSFFAIERETYDGYNYLNLIRTVTDIFDTMNIPYFLEELQELKVKRSEEHPVQAAHLFMESIRSEIAKGIVAEDNLQDLCLQAEEELGLVLKNVAFLAKYKLATIKNIELVKYRHEKAQYRHIHINLMRAITGRTKTVEANQIFRNFTDNKSVLFLKTSENEIVGYLSLSPFIIDINALDNQYSSKLYLYAYEQDGSHYYQFMNDKDDELLEVNTKNYKRIKTELEKFKANIHGKEFLAANPASSAKTSRFSRKRQQQ